jgi:hypothetical protein
VQLDSVRELKQTVRVRHSLREEAHAGLRVLAAGRPQAVLDRAPAIALGAAPTGRPGDYRLAVMVQRRELMDGDAVARIVAAAAGEALVEYIGPGFKQSGGTGRVRPLEVGASVGHPNITAGTLGCFIETGDGVRLLSNNHVLADEDRARQGDPIVQPARYDGGTAPGDAIGHLDEVEPLALGQPNAMDAATARLVEGVDFDPSVPGIGSLAGVAPVEGTEAVAKIGRTTGLTRGQIVRIEAEAVIDYEKGPVAFDGVIHVVTEGALFTEGGDSGSLVFTDEPSPHAVGLHFAGLENGRSVIAPLPAVLARFGASLVL